jgi:hypothetical protein
MPGKFNGLRVIQPALRGQMLQRDTMKSDTGPVIQWPARDQTRSLPVSGYSWLRQLLTHAMKTLAYRCR